MGALNVHILEVLLTSLHKFSWALVYIFLSIFRARRAFAKRARRTLFFSFRPSILFFVLASAQLLDTLARSPRAHAAGVDEWKPDDSAFP